MLKTFATIVLATFFSSAMAQEIKTDRPDQSDGAAVLEKRHFQLESAIYFAKISGEPDALVSSSLIRYGLTKRLEVRGLAEQGHNRNSFMENTAQSQFPLAISGKLAMFDESPSLPALSLVGYLQLPFTNGSKIRQWSSAVLLIAEKELEPFTVTVNLGPKQEAFSHDWSLQTTTDLKYQISKRLEIFTEYFAQFSASLPFHNFDAGVLLQLDKHWMVYLAGGSSIKHDPSNYFFNSGLALHL